VHGGSPTGASNNWQGPAVITHLHLRTLHYMKRISVRYRSDGGLLTRVSDSYSLDQPEPHRVLTGQQCQTTPVPVGPAAARSRGGHRGWADPDLDLASGPAALTFRVSSSPTEILYSEDKAHESHRICPSSSNL